MGPYEYIPTTGIESKSKDGLSVRAAPNPFLMETNISFELAHDAHVRVEIINVTGSVSKVLINNHMNKGKCQVILNGSDLPAGIYLCRMQVDGETATLKILKRE